jgi:putative flavoprotein involved in K+ transport
MDGTLIGTPADAAATAWLDAFARALSGRDPARIGALFHADSHWRDILAFTWDLRTTSGPAAIAERLGAALARMRPRGFALAPGRTPPRRVRRADTDAIEAIFAFETAIGPCNGVVRLVEAGGEPRAWTLMTALDEIRGHEDPATGRRWKEVDWTRNFGGENWLDRRNRARAYADRDPAVLVVGAGQAGLSIAARLGQLGVDTLVVDREARLGDNWRRRYHSLTLHNETRVNHLPYLPFPPTWPVFIPKDMLANWFELYAEAMELNVWTGTELAGGAWDEAAGRWEVRLKRADGTGRVMRPRHIVFAVGVSSIPVTPNLPGLKEFRGTVLHSGDYGSSTEWRGRRALVVGTGTSGHDVAQDLCTGGAEVTIIQRSPTMVVSLKEAQSAYALYDEGIPFEDCDLLATSFPYPVFRRAHQLLTAKGREADRALLEGLERRGFRLTFGPDDTGWQIMYQSRGGGYYFNAGCSEMIVEGRVGLLQLDAIERFAPQGALLKDGTVRPADLIVLATGYENQQEVVRRALGDAIADRVGPVWGFDAEGELRNMWRPTAQPGLWFLAGSLAQCRIYSKTLAMQIKARELGLVA